MIARRARVILEYNGIDATEDISGSLIGFIYNDSAKNEADDIEIILEDREGLWRGAFFPEKGASIKSTIIIENWEVPGRVETLPCGTFELDEIEYKGPPDTASLKGLAVSLKGGIKDTKKSKTWASIALSKIGAAIAMAGGVKFWFISDYDHMYDTVQQNQESDLSFLVRLAKEQGLTVKATDSKIILFDERKFEEKPAVRRIMRNDDDVLSYNFKNKTSETYKQAEVNYTDSKSNETIVGAKETVVKALSGETLKINIRPAAGMEGATAEMKEQYAKRMAEKLLRMKNKYEIVANMTLVGDPNLLAGVTLEVMGWDAFDGTYYIEKASHKVSSSGYVVDVEMRRILEGY